MRRAIVTVLASAGLAACGHLTDPANQSAALAAVSPAPWAVGVAPGARVTITFDVAMDSASCVSRFYLHMGDPLGPMVPGRMMWDSTYHRMTFAPDSMMARGTTYTVHLRDGMMSRGTGTGGRMGGGMGGGMGGMTSMTFDHPPAGALRTGDGVMWSFATSP